MAPQRKQLVKIVALATVFMAAVQLAAGQGQTSAAPSPPLPDQGNCLNNGVATTTAGAGCGVPLMPEGRGICTTHSGLLACYDVCNTAHDPEDYIVANNSVTNQGVTEQVRMVRSGRNPSVLCNGGSRITCLYPMQRCNPDSSSADDDDEGDRFDQGLCVVEKNGGLSCMDMCDDDKEKDDYCHMGSEDCKDLVQFTRDKCNAMPGWAIVLSILGFCCCMGCCLAGGGGLYYSRRGGLRKQPIDDLPPPLEDPMYDQDFQQDQPMDAFDQMDRNHDGILSADEIAAAQATPAPPVAMMAQAPMYPMGSFPTPTTASMGYPMGYGYPQGYPQAGMPSTTGMPMQMGSFQPSFSTNPAQQYYTQYPAQR